MLFRSTAVPKSLTPGTMSFVSCGSWELHGDFMTKAWAPDPLKQALHLVPGYEQTVPAPPVHAKKKA